MRFLAAPALSSFCVAASGLARAATALRGGARNALAAVISSAQIANMIFVFCNLARVALQSAPPGHHLTKAEVGSLLASPPRGQYESVVAVHEVTFRYLRLSQKKRLTAARGV